MVCNWTERRGIGDELGREMPTLSFQLDDRKLFAHPLRGGRVVIGRSDACDVSLPGEDISRRHAVIDQRGDQWWLTDRSRHGTLVNGARVERAALSDGDRIRIGRYVAVFHHKGDEDFRAPTSTAPLWTGIPEELVEVDAEGFTACRPVLRPVHGDGPTHVLRRSRCTLGGPGADVVIDPELPPDAVRLRVARGRLMVAPGTVTARLAGQPVRELTPALRGELLEVGPHRFVVELKARREAPQASGFGDMVGRSEPMQRLFGVLARVAVHDFPVLLLGESGTGKELAAQAIHARSPRATGPFVTVNCAAIASTLFESELFGHEKGAFTGAEQARDGAFQRADKGVLFLDEVGELGLDEQAKLLRALELGGEVRRVGAQASTRPDVRVIAATNRDLAQMVREGTFRSDLYHRLNMLTVRLPPLRDRVEDIVPVAEALLARHHPSATLAPDAKEALRRYAWPGNVRELRNVLLRAVVLGGEVVRAGNIEFFPDSFESAPPRLDLSQLDPVEIERAQLKAALDKAGGNRSRAARDLGIPRSTLLYKLKRHGLDDM